MPSSYSPLRARSNADPPRVRAATARADAIPKLSLYSRPVPSSCRSPGLSWVPANQDPTITWDAPAASASATSRGCRTPPSAHTCLPSRRASAAHSRTAENCGRPTAVIIRVVHIAPGPTPTLTMSAPGLDEVARALGGDDVAGHDGDVGGRGAHGGDGVEHLALVAVRGVDDEDVDAGLEQRRGLRRARRR